MYALTHHTPTADLTTLVDDHGVVRAAGFTDADTLASRLGLDAPPTNPPSEDCVGEAIARYLEGDLDALALIPLGQAGTDFQQLVWDGLVAIPAGQTASYGELAEAIGRPRATRAVGSACGKNLIAPFIPCHRAVRSDGSRGGYLYGLEVKNWLLDHEQAHVQLQARLTHGTRPPPTRHPM